MWEKLPYRLRGQSRLVRRRRGTWPRDARALAKACAQPRRRRLDSFTRTPVDTERSLPNMREGDLLVGAFTNGQIGYHRPFPGAGSYRAHLPGLYLCGSSSHPGGNITGLPGYNAAQVILADHGLNSGWFPPPISDHLAGIF